MFLPTVYLYFVSSIQHCIFMKRIVKITLDLGYSCVILCYFDTCWLQLRVCKDWIHWYVEFDIGYIICLFVMQDLTLILLEVVFEI